MAISLFGKKGEPPAKKKTIAGATEKRRDRAARPTPKPEPVARQESGSPADDDLSLDFSNYVPPPRQEKSTPEPPRPQEGPPPATAAQDDATAPPQAPASEPDAAALPPPEAPAAKPAASTPAPPARPAQKPAPAKAPPAAKPIPAPAAPVVEEATILFANGQSLQALTALAGAVRDGDLGSSAVQVWLMLFDLYQYMGMKAEFEALGMEFLVKFERSPPVWVEPELQFNPALETGGFGYCALTGVLSVASGSEFEQLRRIGDGQPAMRIDFSRLQGVDPLGAASLLEALEILKAADKTVVLTGEEQLLRLLEAECQTGNRDTDGILWSLLFEILKRFDLKDRFEETAVNYAVTYEVSPPSWESAAGAKSEPGPRAVPDESGTPAFRLSGNVTGADEGLASDLEQWAASNSPLVIDLSAVRRVDVASAGRLFNALTKLHEAGAVIQIRGANELIAALFDIVGIGQVARIGRKR